MMMRSHSNIQHNNPGLYDIDNHDVLYKKHNNNKDNDNDFDDISAHYPCRLQDCQERNGMDQDCKRMEKNKRTRSFFLLRSNTHCMNNNNNNTTTTFFSFLLFLCFFLSSYYIDTTTTTTIFIKISPVHSFGVIQTNLYKQQRIMQRHSPFLSTYPVSTTPYRSKGSSRSRRRTIILNSSSTERDDNKRISPKQKKTTIKKKNDVKGKKRNSNNNNNQRSTTNNNNNNKRSSNSNSNNSNELNQRSTTMMLQTWRVFGIEVHPDQLVEYNSNDLKNKQKTEASDLNNQEQQLYLNDAVLDALYTKLKWPLRKERMKTEKGDGSSITTNGFDIDNDIDGGDGVVQGIRVVRRSIDARPNKFRTDGGYGPRYVYVVDIDMNRKEGIGRRQQQQQKQTQQQTQTPNYWKTFKHQPGKIELLEELNVTPQVPPPLTTRSINIMDTVEEVKKIIIVGAGPAGLFCALQILRCNDRIDPTVSSTKRCRLVPILLERGQPVEKRGKDIGTLIHRVQLNKESNFAFGEGGAGTWSDGKLTTRIGRNSDSVRSILNTFVQFGAPSSILVEGAPHLGTDNLVKLLRNVRSYIREQGGEIHFGTKVTDLIIENNRTKGIKYTRTGTEPVQERTKMIDGSKVLMNDELSSSSSSLSGILHGDAVVLATGHSARDVYETLHRSGIQLEPKGFAVGYRIEHPQKIINKIQYGTEWAPTVKTGKVNTDTANQEYITTYKTNNTKGSESVMEDDKIPFHNGTLPVPSYRLATDQAFDGTGNRGVYSFCMCPGGQIVPASTNVDEVCVNGMSFSRRDSQWANSALVVTIQPDDPILVPYRTEHGVLAGVAFQRDMERRAAMMGGGNLTVPVQRVTDFLTGHVSTSVPSSSYRLGIKPAPCHEIYPEPVITSIRNALTQYFDRQMPGYVCDEGLLHGVETRTSSPVRILRNEQTLQAVGTQGLYPAGEGAGFAGGIVSAAVDGMVVADAVINELLYPQQDTDTDRLDNQQTNSLDDKNVNPVVRSKRSNVGSFY